MNETKTVIVEVDGVEYEIVIEETEETIDIGHNLC